MKSLVETALELIKAKLSNGATIMGHEVEMIERALEEALAKEKAPKVKKKTVEVTEEETE